jgi:tRNA pseudouridine13 synthase
MPEDFVVVEELGFEPSGEGEHLFLYVRKRNLTTEQLASDIAKAFGVSARDVGYCGLKDKVAVTEQWLSIVYPIKSVIPDVKGHSWQILKVVRHGKKLRRGIHKSNAFSIRLSNVTGDMSLLPARLELLRQEGFPNYFGQQRFGRDNVERAAKLFAGEFRCKPFQRSIYYSAARSYLFNCYLSGRISAGNWSRGIDGDCYNLDGSNAVFGPEMITPELMSRIALHDIHPVGPLLGEGDCRMAGDAGALAKTIACQYSSLVDGLVKASVKTAWRPLRVMPKSLHWELMENSIQLGFSLPVGSYATALIGELVQVNETAW